MSRLAADFIPADIAIVIPIYNASKTLCSCLDSVLAQSFTAWNALCIDDGSTDNSASIVASYARTDSRIKLFSQVNSGVSSARNLGIRLSSSFCIAFLDSDDFWHCDHLRFNYSALRKDPGLGISFSRCSFVDASGHVEARTSRPIARDLTLPILMMGNPTTTTSTWVVRAEVFDEVGLFAESMSFAEDLELLCRVCATSSWAIRGNITPLVYYRTSISGLSSHLDCMEEGWLSLISQMRQYSPSVIQKHFAKAYSWLLLDLARKAVRLAAGGSSKPVFEYVARALWVYPLALVVYPRRIVLVAVMYLVCGLRRRIASFSNS